MACAACGSSSPSASSAKRRAICEYLTVAQAQAILGAPTRRFQVAGPLCVYESSERSVLVTHMSPGGTQEVPYLNEPGPARNGAWRQGVMAGRELVEPDKHAGIQSPGRDFRHPGGAFQWVGWREQGPAGDGRLPSGSLLWRLTGDGGFVDAIRAAPSPLCEAFATGGDQWPRRRYSWTMR